MCRQFGSNILYRSRPNYNLHVSSVATPHQHCQHFRDQPKMASPQVGAPKLNQEANSYSPSTCTFSTSSSSANMDEELGRLWLERQYPEELIIRNTFLDVDMGRPSSLHEFLQARQVRSAPGSHLEAIDDNEVYSTRTPTPPPPPPQQPTESDDTQPVVQLQLSGLLSQSELGSPELPTVGSAGHSIKRCKPCAFRWKEPGCLNGVQCQFCHLCETGEKKRRSKEKRAHRRSVRANPNNAWQAMSARINSFLT